MQTVFPSQIVKYIDSRYPQAKEQMDGKGSQFHLERDHAPAVQQVLSMVENIPSDLLILDNDSNAEFDEALSAVKFAIDAWKSGDKNFQLRKIPGRQKRHPLTILREHLIKLKDAEIIHQIGELNQVPLTINQIHKLYGAIRSEFVKLPTQAIRNIAAAAGIDVTRITSKAEKRSGIGSRAEIMPQLDQLYGQMEIADKETALQIITELIIKEHPDIKKYIDEILQKHGFRFSEGQFILLNRNDVTESKASKGSQSYKKGKEKMEATVDDPAKVFVIQGRNQEANRAIFIFLRSIGLKPQEWNQIIASMKDGSPYIGNIIEHAFDQAQAVVVFMTPDDEARLRELFIKGDDPKYETNLTPQARPNVLFEAGMAFGRFPKRTIIVELGELRPFSDIAGRHIVKLNNTTQRRQELAQKLKNAGCPVDLDGTEWHSVGEFEKCVVSVSSSPNSALIYKAPYYYKGGDKQPFCPFCWESEKKPIHLDGPHDIPDEKPFYRCLKCGNNF